MDKKTVFVRTDKGEGEAQGLTDALYGDSKRIFNLVDDESNVGELTKRAPPSLRSTLDGVLQELVDGGYIRDINEPETRQESNPAIKIAAPAFKMATPKAAAKPQPAVQKAAPPAAPSAPARPMPAFEMPEMPKPAAAVIPDSRPAPAAADKKNDLDFSFIMSGASPAQDNIASGKNLPDARADAEAEAQARIAAQTKAAQEAAAKDAKRKAYEAAKVKAQIEVAARAKIEAETRAKEAEARARKEADAARQKAEESAAKARIESEAAKARIEAEIRARMEAEAKVKREAEAIRLKAEQEAERLRRELEEAKIRAEIEMRNRLEAEARAKAEQEARLKREAEAERLRLEKQRAELEAARIKAEAELRMREEAEARVRAALDARLKAEASSRAESRPAAPARDVDPGEKLRQSFVETAGQDFKKQGYTTGSFKLEAFSLVDTGKMPAAAAAPLQTPPLPGGGSKVKAAIEARARKQAEEEQRKSAEERLKVEQQRLSAEQQQNAVLQQQQEAARLKAQQESAAASAQAEANAQRLKIEQEAYLRQARQEEEAAKAAADAQQLAEQQSRQWEEAQQRAQALAQAEQERLAAETAAAKAKAKKPPRGPRKRLPLGKIVGGLFALLLIAIVAVPYVMPLDEYIPPLEAEISAQLKQPVHIQKVDGALLPLPRLVLHNMTIGGAEEIRIVDAELNFNFSALLVPAKSISELNLRNVTLTGAALDKSLPWLQTAGAIEKYPVSRMNFKSLRLNVEGMSLPTLQGRAEFDEMGKFKHGQFTTEDEKSGIEMHLEQGNLLLEFNLHDGSLPIFPSLKFNDLSVNARVVNREVVLTDFFAHIHSGTLTGKGGIDFSNGWKLQGQINARNLDVQHMFPDYVLSGELGGEMSVAMSAPSPGQLGKEARFEGSFEVKNGEIRKVDVETVARFGAKPGVAGHTNFTEFSGTLRADRNNQHLFVQKLQTANASTSGVIDVDAAQKLNGRLQVDFKGVLGSANIPLHLSGTAVEPDLQAGR